ncbi:hypothetical protein PFISCL1PPCAC_18666 [Pristionchus fissidentatus]|uniref:Peptidase n=1 Tax=Pristionchus fissidentatus TaxID=1538716 RepID=A0AAV5W9P0_9BILA|nr:hypothetical protein PFISCL1PPCAC_18666 [Pristionchus fissidentatus]
MQRNDLQDFVNKQRTPLNEMKRNEIARSFTRRALARLQMQSSVSACKTFVKTHFEDIVNAFFKSLDLEVDVDYSVCIDKGKNEPALTIVLRNGIRDGYGLLQFIQLRHACTVTSNAMPRAYGEVTRQVHSKTDKSSQQYWNFSFLKNMFETAPAKADPEIEGSLEKKRRLHSQIDRLSEIAHIVHILREPLTTDSPRDIRCDGFVEQIRNRVEDLRNQIQAINDRLVKADLSGWPIASPDIIKNLAKLHGVSDYQKLSYTVEIILKRLGRKSRIRDGELVEAISKALILNEDAQKNWIDLNRNQNLKEWNWMYALSSDAISEGTHFLQYLKHVQLPADYFSNHIQASDRYLGDCQFYVPNNTHIDENALFGIDGTSRENFAQLNRFSRYEDTEIAVLLSFERRRPTFFFLNRPYERLSRDLIQNGVIPCSNYNEILWPTYEDLNLPLIYNSSLTLEDFKQVDPLNLFFELQSAMMEFGSAQWMQWIVKMIHHYYKYRPQALTDGVLNKILSLYHRSIAEKEACLRDEKLITRIRKAFADQSRQVESQYDEMLMDAFVNEIVETINRGDRLVEIKPPFKDDATAEKLARFIRSRRMQPIRDEKDNLKFHI